MPVFGQQGKIRSVSDGLGLGTVGGIVRPAASAMNGMVAGGMMGSLTDMAVERKKAAVGQPGLMGGDVGMSNDQSALFNIQKRKKKVVQDGGFTDESGGVSTS